MNMTKELLNLQGQLQSLLSNLAASTDPTPQELQKELITMKQCAATVDILIERLTALKIQLTELSLEKRTLLDELNLNQK